MESSTHQHSNASHLLREMANQVYGDDTREDGDSLPGSSRKPITIPTSSKGKRKREENTQNAYHTEDDDDEFWKGIDYHEFDATVERAYSSKKKLKTNLNGTQKTILEMRKTIEELHSTLAFEVRERQGAQVRYSELKNAKNLYITSLQEENKRLQEKNDQLQKEVIVLKAECERTPLDCAICHDGLSSPSIIVPCNHVFCEWCIRRVNGNDCPACRGLRREIKRIYFL